MEPVIITEEEVQQPLSKGLLLRASGAHWWSELHVQRSPLVLRMYAARLGQPRPRAPLAAVGAQQLIRLAAHEPKVHWRARCDETRAAFGDGAPDSRPHGCTVVTADVSFPHALEVHGLPERVAPLALRPTLSPHAAAVSPSARASHTRRALASLREPYRLFNLDVFQYDKSAATGLYGSLPYLLANAGPRPVDGSGSAGVVWLNSADTYVDLWREGSAPESRGMNSFWSSEAGTIDLLLLPGPSAARVLSQLSALSGTPPLPPLWAMGYHQSHWNIKSQAQLVGVDANADRFGVPLDALWLDIEHTKGKQYFTWDRERFPDPVAMAIALERKGRRLVGIADPHLKVDAANRVLSEAAAHGYLLRSPDGKRDWTGDCWPGKSAWVDMLNPAARRWWSGLYSPAADLQCVNNESEPEISRFGCLRDGVWPRWLHAWNDMNEPSVFQGGEELTLPRDALHRVSANAFESANIFAGADAATAAAGVAAEDHGVKAKPEGGEGGQSGDCGDGGETGKGGAMSARTLAVEHRLVHNAYGALMASASFDGLARRTGGIERPFLLSRSFFIGSQRHGAVWTGDNSASWEHLQHTTPMVLALGVSGLPFAGADIGGFHGQPSNELLVRWYELAAFHPFCRGHAHVDFRRREPWLLPPREAALVAAALAERQRLLPFWSTLWWAAAHDRRERGLPVARPLWLQHAADAADARALLSMDGAWLLGDALLVWPVTQSGTFSVRAYLPAYFLAHELDGGTDGDVPASGEGRLGSEGDRRGAEISAYEADGGVDDGEACRETAHEVRPPRLVWYSLLTGARQQGGQWVVERALLGATPRWQRGGSIVPRRERVRRSAMLARWGPLSLHVAPDAAQRAQGVLFLDDGHTNNFTRGAGALLRLQFECDTRRCVLNSKPRPVPGADAMWLPAKVEVEQVLLRGKVLNAAALARAKLSIDGETHSAAPHLDLRPSADGVVVYRVHAPCLRSWSLELPNPFVSAAA